MQCEPRKWFPTIGNSSEIPIPCHAPLMTPCRAPLTKAFGLSGGFQVLSLIGAQQYIYIYIYLCIYTYIQTIVFNQWSCPFLPISRLLQLIGIFFWILNLVERVVFHLLCSICTVWPFCQNGESLRETCFSNNTTVETHPRIFQGEECEMGPMMKKSWHDNPCCFGIIGIGVFNATMASLCDEGRKLRQDTDSWFSSPKRVT